MLVDAHAGVVALQYNQVDTALDVAVYDAKAAAPCPATAPSAPSAGCSGATPDAVTALAFITDTYEYYDSMHGRDGLDGAGMQIVATVRYCETGACPYENAFWNGDADGLRRRPGDRRRRRRTS